MSQQNSTTNDRNKLGFVKSVFTLVGGTTLAQVIPILVTPLLTRLYSPEQFGDFALYMAVISIAGVVITGRYDTALMLVKRTHHAEQLVSLLVFVAIALGLFGMGAIFLLSLHFEELPSWYVVLPLGAALYGVYSVLLSWLNRAGCYQQMSRNRITQASSISAFQIIVALIGKTTSGLVSADFLGRFFSVVLFFFDKNAPRIRVLDFSKRKWVLVVKYKKFPILLMPSSLLNIASFQLPYLVIPILFSSAKAGVYFLVFRVIMMPTALIGTAFLEVFKNKAIDKINSGQDCKNLFIKTVALLSAIAILPCALILLVGPQLFAFVFGSSWSEAGRYAQILTPMVLLRFISAPVSFMFIAREKLKMDLVLQCIFCSLTIFSIFFAQTHHDFMLLVWMLSLSGSVFYLSQLVFAYKYSVN